MFKSVVVAAAATLVLARPALAAGPNDACLAENPGIAGKPDIAFARRQIDICTDRLRQESDPVQRSALLGARSEDYFHTRAYVRALEDLQQIESLPPGSMRVAFDTDSVHEAMGYHA